MPTKRELMEAYYDVAEDKQSKQRFADAAKDYHQAIQFYIAHSKENRLSVDAKTGSYSRRMDSIDDIKLFEQAYQLHFNTTQCLKELKHYDAAVVSGRAACSYNQNYKINSLLIEVKLHVPALWKEAEADLTKVLNTHIDAFQFIEHSLDLAKVQFQLKKFEAALVTIKDILERISECAQSFQNNESKMTQYYSVAHSLEGDIHNACNREQESKSAYQQAAHYKSGQEKLQKEQAEQSDSENDIEEMDTSVDQPRQAKSSIIGIKLIKSYLWVAEDKQTSQKYDEAIADYNEALALITQSANHRGFNLDSLGILLPSGLQQRDNQEEVRKLFDVSIIRTVGMAECWIAKGQPEYLKKAIPVFEFFLNSQNKTIYSSLGMDDVRMRFLLIKTLYALGAYQEAFDAMSFMPFGYNNEYIMMRADILSKLNQFKDAFDMYHELAQAEAKDPLRDKIVRGKQKIISEMCKNGETVKFIVPVANTGQISAHKVSGDLKSLEYECKSKEEALTVVKKTLEENVNLKHLKVHIIPPSHFVKLEEEERVSRLVLEKPKVKFVEDIFGLLRLKNTVQILSFSIARQGISEVNSNEEQGFSKEDAKRLSEKIPGLFCADPNEYDLQLMSRASDAEFKKNGVIEFKCDQSIGLDYRVMGFDNEVKRGLIMWNQLPFFQMNDKERPTSKGILANKVKLLPQILDVTSKAGHTANNSLCEVYIPLKGNQKGMFSMPKYRQTRAEIVALCNRNFGRYVQSARIKQAFVLLTFAMQIKPHQNWDRLIRLMLSFLPDPSAELIEKNLRDPVRDKKPNSKFCSFYPEKDAKESKAVPMEDGSSQMRKDKCHLFSSAHWRLTYFSGPSLWKINNLKLGDKSIDYYLDNLKKEKIPRVSQEIKSDDSKMSHSNSSSSNSSESKPEFTFLARDSDGAPAPKRFGASSSSSMNSSSGKYGPEESPPQEDSMSDLSFLDQGDKDQASKDDNSFGSGPRESAFQDDLMQDDPMMDLSFLDQDDKNQDLADDNSFGIGTGLGLI